MIDDRLKFRVWDNERRQYTSVNPVVLCNDRYTREIAMQDNEDCQYVIEQCTGLEDENGKLIFEGDKVRMTEFYFDGFGEEERNFVGYVMWNKGEFVLSKNPEKPEYENETEIIPHLSWGHSFEIIGNIHDGEKRT